MTDLLTFCSRIDAGLAEKRGRLPRIRVHCIVVNSRETLTEALRISKVTVSDRGDRFAIAAKVRIDEGFAEFVFVPVDGSGWMVVSQHPSRYGRQLIDRLVNTGLGGITRLHLRSNQMRSLFQSFYQALGLEHSEVISFSARRDSEFVGETVLPKISLALWQQHAEGRFEEYERLGAYLVSFRFRARGRGRIFSAQMHRDVVLTMIRGEFTPFVTHLVEPALQMAIGNLHFFRDRSRIVQNERVVLRPIELKLKTNLVEDHFRVLNRALARVCVSAQLYSGNPYFLATCYDKIDQSIYRVAALGNRIVIVPLDRTTDDALQRVFVAISDSFTETEPQDFEQGRESVWIQTVT